MSFDPTLTDSSLKSLQLSLPGSTSVDSTNFVDYMTQKKAQGIDVLGSDQIMGFDTAPWLEGRLEFWLHEPGCTAGLRNMRVKSDFAVSSLISNRLSLEWVLDGNFDIDLGGRTTSNRGLPRAYLASHLSQGRQTRFYKKGDEIRSIGLWLPPEFMAQHFGLNPDELSPAIRSVLLLEREATITLPLTTRMRSTLGEIMDHPYQDAMAIRYLHAKITEMLCYFSDSISSPVTSFEVGNDLPRHKAQAMSTVIQYISNNIASPPGIEYLAELTALSRSVLSTTFRNSLGISISEYLLQTRMEAAYELLRAGNLSVLEVALAVGYEDQSAFGRAYKRHHNHPPRDDKPHL